MYPSVPYNYAESSRMRRRRRRRRRRTGYPQIASLDRKPDHGRHDI